MSDQLSPSAMCYNVPSRRQWSICMDTFHTMALPSHCCIVFEKEKRNTKCHYEWLQKFESAKPGYALGALFGFLVLIMSRVLPAGILGLGLHMYFDDQKFLLHRKAQFTSLSFPSYGPLVPASSLLPVLMFMQPWGKQGRVWGWLMTLGSGAVCGKVFHSRFLL